MPKLEKNKMEVNSFVLLSGYMFENCEPKLAPYVCMHKSRKRASHEQMFGPLDKREDALPFKIMFKSQFTVTIFSLFPFAFTLSKPKRKKAAVWYMLSKLCKLKTHMWKTPATICFPNLLSFFISFLFPQIDMHSESINSHPLPSPTNQNN